MNLGEFLKKIFKRYPSSNSESKMTKDLYLAFFLNEFEFAISGQYFRGIINANEAQTNIVIFRNQNVPVIDLQNSLKLNSENFRHYQKIIILEIDNMYLGIFCHREGKTISDRDSVSAPIVNPRSILSLIQKIEITKTLITFSMDRTYAVDVEDICEVMSFPASIKTSSSLPAIVRGYFQHKGEPVYIINTPILCNYANNPDYNSKEILIIKKDNLPYALMVDSFEFFVLFPKDRWLKSDSDSENDISQKVIIQPHSGETKIIHLLNLNMITRTIAHK